MKRFVLGLMAAGAGAAALAHAQAPTPFKLGTFERQGRAFVGVVLREALVVDLEAASAAVATVAAARVPAPADMKDLIARYDVGVRDRIREIVAAVEKAGGARPAWVHDLNAVKTLPPIMYPTTMLNVAVNYREHAEEIARRDGQALPAGGAAPLGSALPGTQSAPGIWGRAADDQRWNPYMFVKLPSAIIADGEAIRIPPGRTQIDWECELGVVIGRRASRVPAQSAAEFIFGYTLENDVSDRGGRGDTRHGSDWLVAKNHDTFAPLGPFITPREFVPNPQSLPVKFVLNGQVMQDANTSLMIHNVFEQVAYASSILTLQPGDVIATGSPAGVGSARKPPIFLKAGDRSVCTYEGVGTLTNPVQ